MIDLFSPQQPQIGHLSQMFNDRIKPLAEGMTEGEQLLSQVRGELAEQREVFNNPFEQPAVENELTFNEIAEVKLPEFDMEIIQAPDRQAEGSTDYNGSLKGDDGSFDPASFTFNKEARISGGKLKVYNPPSGDGGGAYEVAGITARYQPKEAARLRSLINQGKNAQAISEAKAFYRRRGAPFTKHATQKGLQLQLSDTVHHRGEGGLRRILQRATGSKSRSYSELIRTLDSKSNALSLFNKARRDYEWQEVDRGRASRKKFKRGLANRFNSADAAARKANLI